MKSKIVYLSIIFAILAIGLYMVTLAPYHIYTLSITEGVNTKFLEFSETKATFLDGSLDNLGEKVRKNDDNLFELYHFSHFVMPFPTNHSLYYLNPVILIKEQLPKLGASFTNAKNVALLGFDIEKPYRFTLESDNQALFELPIFNNYIRRKRPEDLWRDIYSKKLSLPSSEGESFFKTIKELKEYSVNELVYNLYILYNRKKMFSDDVINIKFLDDKKIGIVELPSNDDKVLNEKIFILENGFVYPILLTTRKNDYNAMNFRSKFIRELTFRESSVDSAVALYARYQNLSYQQRISQVGMVFLYSAWSHDINNPEYIRFIIQFLERNKNKEAYLLPFYDYAFNKFGSSFSKDISSLKEDVSETIKRKGEAQLADDIKAEKERKDIIRVDDFTSDEEKIFYHLNQAKESVKNQKKSDDTKRAIIMD